MVVHFKMHAGATAPVYPISKDNIEEMLGRRAPWFCAGQDRDDHRYYAVCPYCNNPIQLKGLYRRQVNSPRVHGSHTGKPQEGFPNFNLTDLEFCPYKLKGKKLDKSSRREMGEAAQRLIELAVSEFDRVVYLLRKDFGFPFSVKFARKMLEGWFDAEGYLYEGAHLRNLPWMIAYFGPTQSLYKQFVGANEALSARIRRKIEGATISEEGQLSFAPGAWRRIDLQCYHHKATLDGDEAELSERMKLRVQDFSNTNDPTEAPLIYSKFITFTPAEFERLIRKSAKNAYRNNRLIEIAANVATSRGF